jgi:hypothetical protein
MFPPQLHKIGIVPFLDEDILAVVPSVVDVIEVSIGERHSVVRHGFLLNIRPVKSLYNNITLTI